MRRLLAVARSVSAVLGRIYRGGWGAMMLVALLGTASLLYLTWSTVLDRLAAEERILIASASREQENVAAIVAENLVNVLDRGRRFALTVSGDRNSIASSRQMRDLQSIDSAYLRVVLFDRRGSQLASSSQPDIGSDVREAIKRMFSGEPLEARTRIVSAREGSDRGWQMPVLFPVPGRGSQPEMAVLGIIDLGYLLGLYQSIDIGRTGAISVFESGGLALAEMRRAGMMLHPERLISGEISTLDRAEKVHTTRLRLRGVEHLVSFRFVEGFPLVVAISREMDDIRIGRDKTQIWIRDALGGITFVIVLAILWVFGNLYRQSQLLKSLRNANHANRDLIAQLQEEKKRAVELAANDQLTGLHNRRMFNELATSHLLRARRSHKHYALMYLDLDRFKGINDTLGHHVGDLLLKEISRRLSTTLRESDVVARLGGDEFAVLLTGLERVGDAESIAAKLVSRIAEPCIGLDGHDLQVATSIGIAVYPRDGQSVDMLCRHADAAMYVAKRSGRGRFVFYDPSLNPAGEWKFELEQRLPRAIADGEMLLHFQPKVRLPDFTIAGFEALVRWQHPEFGLVYPKDFIDLAENTGDIVALGQWVIDSCCRQLASWRQQGVAVLPISINVSARQLLEADFAAAIEAALARHNTVGALLEFEITESALIHSVSDVGVVLRRIRALGARIALDDFGKGFSNLGYIRTLPIDTLKIDREFVSNMRNDSDSAVIVDSIIALAHNLRMRVVAEGVESLDQVVHLRAANCDEAQGYFLSRPLPAESILPLLKNPVLEPK